MKKLIIRDHLGEVVLGVDVYLEGQDFTHTEPVPKAMWVKEIYICDPDKLPEWAGYKEVEVAPEPELEPELEPVTKEQKERMWKNIKADVAREEVEHELEAAINQSVGDKGSGETEQLKSPEAASTKPAKRKTTKRSS